jgi:apolipoprotein N-acyltransferase
LYWIYVVVSVHGHAAPPVAVAAVLGLAAYVGVHVGLAGAVAAWAWDRAASGLALLVVPSAWVVAEHLRTFDLWSGFPWAFLGYALHELAPARVIARVTGVWGLSFLLLLLGALLWAPPRARLRGLLGLVVAVGALFVVGYTVPGPVVSREPMPRVGIVQASIPQEIKWDPRHAREAFQAHLDVSWQAAEGGVDLLVWPEASVPVFLQLEREYLDSVLSLARETSSLLLVGGVGLEPNRSRREFRYYNSVFLIDPEGVLAARYDKSRLVPFGEYVPFRQLLGFLSGIATGIAAGDVTPGPGPRAFDLDPLGPAHALGPLICYEVIYPDLVRRAARSGAQVIVNITNDAWYGRTSAPHQFLVIAAMRAAEHGLPMVRAANTGISAIVDADGAVVSATPIYERTALRGSLPGRHQRATPYTWLGDWIVWASWGILALAGGRVLVGRRQRRDPRDGGPAPRASGAGGGAAEASLTPKASDSASGS